MSDSKKYQAACETCTWISDRDDGRRHAQERAHRVRVVQTRETVHDFSDSEKVRELSRILDEANIPRSAGGFIIRRTLRGLGVSVANGLIPLLVRQRKASI